MVKLIKKLISWILSILKKLIDFILSPFRWLLNKVKSRRRFDYLERADEYAEMAQSRGLEVRFLIDEADGFAVQLRSKGFKVDPPVKERRKRKSTEDGDGDE